MAKVTLKRTDGTTFETTQEWVNENQKKFNKLGLEIVPNAPKAEPKPEVVEEPKKKEGDKI